MHKNCFKIIGSEIRRYNDFSYKLFVSNILFSVSYCPTLQILMVSSAVAVCERTRD